MHSMTGFGRGSALYGGGKVIVEIKTVNHRFLEVRCHAPRELLGGEVFVAKRLREQISRGYCTVHLVYQAEGGGNTAVNEGALQGYLNSLIDVASDTELCLADLIPVLAGAPDIFKTPVAGDDPAFESALQEAFDQAAASLVEMRATEGQAMAAAVLDILSDLRREIDAISKLAKTWPQIAFERINERMQAFLSTTEAHVDRQRLEAEVALLVDKADINEELIRLKNHCDKLAPLTATSGPVGRQLEFIVQELGREANTVAAKASLPEITTRVVKLKTSLEKMKELAQNIE